MAERCPYCTLSGKITAFGLCTSCDQERQKQQVCSKYKMLFGFIQPYTLCECNVRDQKCKQCRDGLNADGCGKCFICWVEKEKKTCGQCLNEFILTCQKCNV